MIYVCESLVFGWCDVSRRAGGLVGASARHFTTWIWFGRNFYSDALLLDVILFAMPSATYSTYGACFSASELCFDARASFVSHLVKMHLLSVHSHILYMFRFFALFVKCSQRYAKPTESVWSIPQNHPQIFKHLILYVVRFFMCSLPEMPFHIICTVSHNSQSF